MNTVNQFSFTVPVNVIRRENQMFKNYRRSSKNKPHRRKNSSQVNSWNRIVDEFRPKEQNEDET
jgi:hypothetical protein